jgi:hypothetical protein
MRWREQVGLSWLIHRPGRNQSLQRVPRCAVMHDDIPAVRRHAQRNGATQPARGAGDEGNFLRSGVHIRVSCFSGGGGLIQ